uniref:U37-Sparatoxin-Hju1a_1 n=1 Tax=Heteropoda jugulans TaxID=1358901 RepID=A0A4Q8K9Q5_9ARAC
MKTTVAMMLLFVVFSAVALAEKEIENAVSDPVFRGITYCSGYRYYCEDGTKARCCSGLTCKNKRCVKN